MREEYRQALAEEKKLRWKHDRFVDAHYNENSIKKNEKKHSQMFSLLTLGKFCWQIENTREKKNTFPGRSERIKKNNECVLEECGSLTEQSKQEGVFLKYPL